VNIVQITPVEAPESIVPYVEDSLDQGYSLNRVDGCGINQGMWQDGDQRVVIPHVTYDVSYLGHLIATPNAVKVDSIEIAGVACEFYERVDKTKTGYVIIEEDEAASIYYVEV